MIETQNLSSSSLYLAIDQGGHASRALVFDYRGNVVAEGHQAISISRPRPDWVEQDPEELVESIRIAVDKAVATLGQHRHRLVAAGLATQRSSIACWDKQTGAALTPVISWQDRRAHDWLDRFSAYTEKIHHNTGLPLTAHYGVSKMRWCLDHVPAVKQAREQGRLALGPMSSFLLFRLLEERPLLVDPANASRTLLWSLKGLDWDPELLTLFEVPLDLLPRSVPTRFEFGHLPIGDQRVPLRIVNGDQSAAMFAYGRLQPDTAYINTGTGAFVSRPAGHYRGYARRLLASIILQENDETTYVLEGTVNGAGSALDWVTRELGLDRLFERLPEWFARSSTPPLFLNGISGLGSPYWIPDFASRFIGEGEDWEKAVAVVESIIFLLQANLEEMLKLSSPPQQIQISGGLASLDALCQRLADVTGLPVYRPVEREATARGIAYLLAGGPAHWPETDLGIWFKPAPNPPLIERYRHWRDAMQTAMRNESSAA